MADKPKRLKQIHDAPGLKIWQSTDPKDWQKLNDFQKNHPGAYKAVKPPGFEHWDDHISAPKEFLHNREDDEPTYAKGGSVRKPGKSYRK